MFDSVFSKFEFKLKHESDKLPLGEKKVLSDLDKLQSNSQKLLNNTLYDCATKLVKKLDIALSAKDLQSVESANWNLLPQLQRNLWGIWLSGWELGDDHGQQEINLVSQNEFSYKSNIIEFKEKAKNRSIRNKPAEKAIRDRINVLAKDIDRTEFKRIKNHLLASVTPQSGTGQPISRNELIKRINSELGAKGRFSRRAETIARTELTFAYNTGRLQTYRDSGLVEAVIFYTILDERRCPACASRQGLVIRLDDWVQVAKNTPALHPNCRCVLSPILKKQKQILDDPTRKVENMNLALRPDGWVAAGILAAVLLGSTGVPVTAANLAIVATQITKPVLEKVAQPKVEVNQTPQIMVNGVDLNTASIEQLLALVPARYFNARQARSLVNYRQKTPLQSIDDLTKVPEIGVRTYARLKALSEGSNIFTILDPANIKTSSQLWAANLGLTRSQARTIFEDMQRNGAYRDIQDFEQRLKGKGIGKKTIKNMEGRLTILKQQQQQQQQQQKQGDFSKAIFKNRNHLRFSRR